jgi:hypothetical protein
VGQHITDSQQPQDLDLGRKVIRQILLVLVSPEAQPAQLTQDPSFQGLLPHHAQVSQPVYISLHPPPLSLSLYHHIHITQSFSSSLSLLSSNNTFLQTLTHQLNINNNGWWLR